MYIDETKWGTYTSLNRDQVTVAKYLIPVQQDDKTCNAHINVKFRSVRLTTVTVEKAIIITYSQCVSLALVIQHAERMCPIILSFVTCLVHTYVSTLSHKGYDFLLKKKVTEYKMCVLIFSTTFIWNFLILGRAEWYDHKYTRFFIWSTRYSCQILKKLEFSRQILEKYWNIKFHENPSRGSRDVPRGRTDRHDEVNSRIPQFCERVQKWQNLLEKRGFQLINTNSLKITFLHGVESFLRCRSVYSTTLSAAEFT